MDTKELENLFELKQKGIISDEEFNLYRDEFLHQENSFKGNRTSSNVEVICSRICKIFMLLSFIMAGFFFVGAIEEENQDAAFFSIYFFIYGLYLLLWLFIATIPTTIAKNRGVENGELKTITILSWLGSFFFITWIIALVFACIYKPTRWINENAHNVNENDAYQSLEKLGNLKEKGLISEDEFNREKNKLMNRI